MSLTPPQFAELTQRLAERGRDLQEKIRETLPGPADERLIERAGTVLDEADEATSSAEQDFNHSLLEHYASEMQKIEAARERSLNGELDCCADCGDEIGYERLHAHPYAVRCIDCQARYEQLLNFTRQARG